MSAEQIILYIFIALIVILFIRKKLNVRNIRQYSVHDVKNRIKSGNSKEDIVLLDVRTDMEHTDRHIKGSVHIPLNDLILRMDELKNMKGKEIICYCRSGHRSSSAAILLQKKGFKTANMKGGMIAWDRESQQSEKTRPHL